MEYKNTWMLSVSIVVLLLFGIYLLLPIGKHVKFKKGKKANAPDFLVENPLYKRKLLLYRTLRVLSVLALGASLVCCAYLISRPFVTEVTEEPLYGRDIYLCMDISGSVSELNEKLVEELKTVVDSSKDDRFGIIIFNTSAVILCPLTLDHEYIKQSLDEVKNSLAIFLDDNAVENMGLSDYYNAIDFISNGTLVDADTRGSSLIGDGMAYCSIAFPDLEKDEERVRLVIFSTDNDLAGEPLCTLKEAANLCKKKNIKVFGIGTEFMLSEAREELKEAVISTGGKYYNEEESLKGIIADIDKEAKSLLVTKTNITENEKPEAAFIALLISMGLFFLFMRASKH